MNIPFQIRLPSISATEMKTATSSYTPSPQGRSTNRTGQFAPVSEPTDRPSPGSSRRGNRILLVDDDPTVRDSLNDVLESEGYVVITAENGQQALELIDKLPVDLVMLDLNMPIKNGWDTFERLTAGRPLIPIIIATARPNQLFTALSAGAAALLEKPMDIPTLLQTIEKLLAETADQCLARLAGKHTEFHYQPATARR
jgi:DNA-binding response OmpR family regulator